MIKLFIGYFSTFGVKNKSSFVDNKFPETNSVTIYYINAVNKTKKLNDINVY